MTSKNVINGKEMSDKGFAIWIGKTVNKAMVKTLKKKGYTIEKISEITDLKESLVRHYCEDN